ncbi:MAG TPA: sigma factor-like helix-turn-helix DNA-binding protein, partial [Planctomycetota bacterium]|nr:sigma factor-like helix-turn-helix DNA-binding protein [Planctomycetota bacterium]
ASIARHLASKHRRSERRRQQREQRAARAEGVPPDTACEDRELFQRLTTAVLALPEPYQITVLQRYLRDLPPSAIAERTGVPLATVKARLQRGVALLREQLDRDSDAWRPALCSVLGLERALPVGAAAITTTGVMLMGTAAKLTLGGLAALLALALWMWSASGSPTMRPTATPIAQPSALAIEGSSPAGRIDRNQRSELAAANVTAVPADPRTVVRGRCVDEYGKPLPRCAVELRGRKVLDHGGPDFRHEYGQWLQAHPGKSWRDIAAATDGEGNFEVAFDWIPLGYELMLRRDTLDHIVRIGGLEPGKTRDLGDVVLQVTCALHGRVVDTNGVPVSSPLVRIQEWPKDRSHVVEQNGSASQGPDGTFTKRVVAGDFEVYVQTRDVVRGDKLSVPARTEQVDVEIVVRAVTAADTITGTVADESGQPIEGARATLILSMAAGQGATTDSAGRFTLCRPGNKTPDQVMLFARKSGWVTKEPDWVNTRWGEHDLRFVLAREPQTDLELHVVCAADGKPVTDYQVRVYPGIDRNDEWTMGPFLGGRHDDGVSRLPDLPARTESILVEPDRWNLWTALVPLSRHAGNQRLEVRLPAAAERLLRVQRSDGEPAAGIAVEQIDPGKAELTLAATAWPMETWRGDWPALLLLRRSNTDARGELRLRGPSDRAIALRLPGPGHAPLLVTDVAVSVAEPLVITLSRGARLEGRLGPLAVARELRVACGLPAEGPAPPHGVPNCQAGLRLRRGDGDKAVFVPPGAEQPTMVDGDGSFVFDGVPPGTWQVTLVRWEADQICYGGFAAQFIEPVATVDLRSGETTTVTIDLPDWLLADLDGQVMTNDLPMANQRIGLSIKGGADGLGPAHLNMQHTLRTDAEGRFHVRIRQGITRVILQEPVRVPGFMLWDTLFTRDEVFAPAGESTTHVFHLDTGKVRLRVLDDTGKPVSDVGLFLRDDDGYGHQ